MISASAANAITLIIKSDAEQRLVDQCCQSPKLSLKPSATVTDVTVTEYN